MSDTTQATPTVRTVDGRTVPPAGTYSVDASHSTVEFVARHLMVTKVRGRFADYAVELHIAEVPEQSRVDVVIQSASISTGDAGRDGHVSSPDFLDVAQYPTLEFHSTSVTPAGGEWSVTGDLTIHGVTRPVELAVTFGGLAEDPWGNQRAFFSASTEFDREDFGLSWNQPLAGGGVLIGKKVKVELEIQAIAG